MKSITLQVTDVQHYYLTKLAKYDFRSIPSLLYVLLHWGCVMYYSEESTCLDILPGDYTDDEIAKANDPERMQHITRIAYDEGSSFEELLGFNKQAIDLEGTIAKDADRNLESEIAELQIFKDLCKKRQDEFIQKRRAEWEAKQAETNT
tara:strand:+ start:353 stop:799 length:447 start_codon:yes stop_codon:yes gene_type:complete